MSSFTLERVLHEAIENGLTPAQKVKLNRIKADRMFKPDGRGPHGPLFVYRAR